jgi:hypothetical protein
MDTNTPINSSADKVHIEFLWRKRFGIEKTPLERLDLYLLNKEEWTYQDFIGKWYHNLFPEFTIKRKDIDNPRAFVFYLFSQSNNTPNWSQIEFFYHQTLLTAYEGVFLDGAKYFTVTPDNDLLYFDNYRYVMYRYYLKDTFRYKHHRFFDNYDDHEAQISKKQFLKLIMIFNDDNEKKISRNMQYSTLIKKLNLLIIICYHILSN